MLTTVYVRNHATPNWLRQRTCSRCFPPGGFGQQPRLHPPPPERAPNTPACRALYCANVLLRLRHAGPHWAAPATRGESIPADKSETDRGGGGACRRCHHRQRHHHHHHHPRWCGAILLSVEANARRMRASGKEACVGAVGAKTSRVRDKKRLGRPLSLRDGCDNASWAWTPPMRDLHLQAWA